MDCLFVSLCVCKSLCPPAVNAECRVQTYIHSNQHAKFQHDSLSILSVPSSMNNPAVFCAGYAFLLFQDESSVQALIDACIEEDGKLYLCVSSPTIKDKPVSGKHKHNHLLTSLDVFTETFSLVLLLLDFTSRWICIYMCINLCVTGPDSPVEPERQRFCDGWISASGPTENHLCRRCPSPTPCRYISFFCLSFYTRLFFFHQEN